MHEVARHNLPPPRQIVRRQTLRLEKPRVLTRIHQFTALASRARTEVDDAVRRLHHFRIMFDDDDGIAAIAQALQRRDEAFVVARMKSDSRLIEDIENTCKP